MKFTITFDVPDGTKVTLGDYMMATEEVREPQYVPPFADELIPLPDAIPLPGDPVPFRGMAQNAPQGAECPVHHLAWTVRPAGVAKATGKPYSAFWKCDAPGKCDQRPSDAFRQAHPL